jgi:hypothetical protein
MSNLHGEFLSIHKISQALPGVPKNAKAAKEPQRKRGPFFQLGRSLSSSPNVSRQARQGRKATAKKTRN